MNDLRSRGEFFLKFLVHIHCHFLVRWIPSLRPIVFRLILEKELKQPPSDKLFVDNARNGCRKIVELFLKAEWPVNALDENGCTPLLAASGKGCDNVVETLMEQVDINLNIQDNSGNTALIAAAKNGRLQPVRLLVKHDDIDLNARNNENETAWHSAVKGGYTLTGILKDHCSKIEALLKAKGADGSGVEELRALLELKKRIGEPSDKKFVDSARNNRFEIVELFIATRWPVNVSDENGCTPILAAAGKGCDKVVEILLKQADINLNIQDNDKNTALIAAAKNGCLEVVRLLVEHDEIDLDARNNKNDTAWHSVVKGEYTLTGKPREHCIEIEAILKTKGADGSGVEELRALLELEKRIGEPGDKKFIDSARNDKLEIVELFIAVRWPVNVSDENDCTPLLAASGKGCDKVVETLLKQADINPNIQDRTGDTALISAARNACLEVVRLLVEHDEIDLDARNNENDTAWHSAVKGGYMLTGKLRDHCSEIEAILKAKGADDSGVEELRALLELEKRIGEPSDKKFIDSARNNKLEIVELFIAARWPVNVSDENGCTPLIAASGNGRDTIVQFLLKHPDIDPNIPDIAGNTALIAAAGKGYPEPVRLLLEHKKTALEIRNFDMDTAWFAAVKSGIQYNGVIKQKCRQIEELLNAHEADNTGVERLRARTLLEKEGIFSDEEFIKRVEWDDITKVKMFVTAGQDINARGADGNTGLIVASRNGCIEMVQLLLEQDDIDANLRNKNISALLAAAIKKHDHIVALLKEKGAKEPGLKRKVALARISETGFEFNSREFFKAVTIGNIEIVRLFIEAGIDLEGTDSDGNTALIIAARFGWLQIVELLLKKNVDVNTSNKFNINALMAASDQGYGRIAQRLAESGVENSDLQGIQFIKAIENSDIGQVKKLLLQGASPDYRDRSGIPPLIKAIAQDDEEIVRVLLTHDASVNSTDARGNTPLMAAAVSNLSRMIEIILDAKAGIDVVNRDGQTALLLAVRKGNADAVEILLKNNAATDIRDFGGWNAMAVAARNKYPDIMKMLREAGAADWNAPALLIDAAYYGQMKKLKKALDMKVDVDSPDDEKKTPLMIAAQRGWVDIVTELESGGADIDHTDINGDTALILAARSGQSPVVRFLLENSCFIDHKNNSGRTALMEAAANGWDDIVSMLADVKAAVDVIAEDGTTALIEACHYGSYHAVILLLNDENKNRRVRFGCTPLMTAALAGHSRVIEYLEKQGASEGKIEIQLFSAVRNGNEERVRELIGQLKKNPRINEQLLKDIIEAMDKEGQTVLMEAVCNGYPGIVRCLIDAGADVARIGPRGYSLVDMAAVNGRYEVIGILLENKTFTKWDESSEWKFRNSALYFGAKHGHADIVEKLLDEKEVRLNAGGKDRSPLIIAAGSGYADVVRVLVEHDKLKTLGTDMSSQLKTALKHAIYKGHHETGRILMEKITVLDDSTVEGLKEANLILAAKENDKINVGRILKLEESERLDYHHTDFTGRTALIWACKNQNLEIVKLLLNALGTEGEKKRAVNASDLQGMTPLMFAAMGKDDNIARLLVANGANVSARSGEERTALLEACRKNNDAVVRLILGLIENEDDKKLAVNSQDKKGNTPLKEAISGGFVVIKRLLEEAGARNGSAEGKLLDAAKRCREWEFRLLLKEKIDVNIYDHSGNTPLFLAAKKNCPRGVELLIDNGAKVEGRALLEASSRGFKDVVRILLSKNADIGTVSSTGRTALMEAAENGHTDILDLLLNKGTRINTADKTGTTALMLAAGKHRYKAVQRLLNHRDIEIDARNHDGETCLYLAHLDGKHTGFNTSDLPEPGAMLGNQFSGTITPIEKLLLDRGARDGWDEAELILAVNAGLESRVRDLLNRVSPHATDNEGKTPLHLAAARGDWSTAQLLLKNGASRDSRCGNERTPLMEAAKAKSEAIVQCLLNIGETDRANNAQVNVNAYDFEKNTALIEAVRADSPAIVRQLIQYGATAGVNNKYGHTPLSEAAKTGNTEIIQCLLPKRVNLNSRDDKHRTPVMEAAENGHYAALEQLVDAIDNKIQGREIKRKALLSRFDKRGKTALDMAVDNGHHDCRDLIKKKGGLSVKETGLSVQVTPTGECYHKFESCGATKNARQHNLHTNYGLHEAWSRGYVSCKKCSPDEHAARQSFRGVSEEEINAPVWSE